MNKNFITLITVIILIFILCFYSKKEIKTTTDLQNLKKCLNSLEPRLDEYERLQKRLFSSLSEVEQTKTILSRDQIKQKYGIL